MADRTVGRPAAVVGDTTGFLSSLAALPQQLVGAHASAGSMDPSQFPSADDVTSVVVAGMGGSGIAGDVLATVVSGTLAVPVVVLKQIRTPAFVGPGTLFFALSYRGNTEETLAMTDGAIAQGARVVTVSAGGALEARAAASGGCHIACEPGHLPRAALGALVAPLFVTLFRMGMLPDAHSWLVSAQDQLARRRDQCTPDIDAPKNPARELARKIGRTLPLIYGPGALGATAAYRWKCDMNENAKSPAFSSALPELTHNEICGWGQHGDVTRQIMTLVQLRHDYEHERLSARVDANLEIIDEAVHQILDVRAEGESRLAQLLDLMYLGSWTSCYVALDNDVDPGPIDAINWLQSKIT